MNPTFSRVVPTFVIGCMLAPAAYSQSLLPMPLEYKSRSFGNSHRLVGVADVNLDGRSDLILALSSGVRDLSVLLGTAIGGFIDGDELTGVSPPVPTIGYHTRFVRDLDRDGVVEIILSHEDDGFYTVGFNPDGTFTQPVAGPFAPNAAQMWVDDGDRDAVLDLFIASAATDPDTQVTTHTLSFVPYTSGQGLAPLPQVIGSTVSEIIGIFLGDTNGDQVPDFLMIDEAQDIISVASTAPGTWSDPSVVGNTQLPVGSEVDVFIGDYDGDGTPDIFLESTLTVDVVDNPAYRFVHSMRFEYRRGVGDGSLESPVLLAEKSVQSSSFARPFIYTQEFIVDGSPGIGFSTEQPGGVWRTHIVEFDQGGGPQLDALPADFGVILPPSFNKHFERKRFPGGALFGRVGSPPGVNDPGSYLSMYTPSTDQLHFPPARFLDWPRFSYGDVNADGVADLIVNGRILLNLGTPESPRFSWNENPWNSLIPIAALPDAFGDEQLFLARGYWPELPDPLPGPPTDDLFAPGFTIVRETEGRLAEVDSLALFDSGSIHDIFLIDVVGQTVRVGVMSREREPIANTSAVYSWHPGNGFTRLADILGYYQTYDGVVVADVDGDTHPDILSNSAPFGIRYGGQADGGYGVQEEFVSETARNTVQIRTADLTGNGRDEIIVHSIWGADISVWSVSPSREITLLDSEVISLDPGSSYDLRSIAVGDIDGDTIADIVGTNWNQQVAVLLGLGDGRFGPESVVTIPGGTGLDGVGLADLRGSRAKEIVVSLAGHDEKLLILDSDLDIIETTRFRYQSWNTRGFIIMDLNGDGYDDVITHTGERNQVGGSPSIHLQRVVACPADLTGDGVVNFFDLGAFLTGFNTQEPIADLAAPFGVFNFFDLGAFLEAFNAGCP